MKSAKRVVATNVGETSLTIDGVRVVIDSGLARIARYDPRRGINNICSSKKSVGLPRSNAQAAPVALRRVIAFGYGPKANIWSDQRRDYCGGSILPKLF